MKLYFIIFVICFMETIIGQNKFEEIDKLINSGSYQSASLKISEFNRSSLSAGENADLAFRKDLMERIRKDFTKTEEDIKKYLIDFYPNVNQKMLENWEADNSLEMKIIDGQKMYFKNAGRNLFRINSEAKKAFEKIKGVQTDTLDKFLEKYLVDVVDKLKNSKNTLVKPQKIKIKYLLSVQAGAVPAGEIIRCWMPYPIEGRARQMDINLLSANCQEFTIAGDGNKHRTIYMQKAAENGKPTEFEVEFSYTAFDQSFNLDFEKEIVWTIPKEISDQYLLEREPHILFSKRVKELSTKIVGIETNPMKKLKLIYEWISKNIPWASALEYSTINNITDYCISQNHGDCGIQSLLFISLCRYNGIPAKWQSGWMLHPGSLNLHDWAEVYIPQIGWVPVDQSFKLQNSVDPRIKYYYLGGIDSYHLIVNDDISEPLYPAKIFPRSETVDFQRGEVEWRGGNLYFDKWDYEMNVEFLPIK